MTNDPSAARSASWGDFAAAAPDLAAAGLPLLDRSTGPAQLATVRGPDAPPRIHPVTVAIVDGGLFVFLLDSAKRKDLVEDGRYALHGYLDASILTEFSLRGRARLIAAGEVRDRVAAGWAFEVDDTYWLFELRIETAILGERAPEAWPPNYRRWSSTR